MGSLQTTDTIELLAIASIRYRDGKVAFDVPAFFRSLAVHGYRLELGWRPIETAPIRTRILTCDDKGQLHMDYFSIRPTAFPERATHWRPLPEPPEGATP